MAFFLDGVQKTAEGAVSTAQRLADGLSFPAAASAMDRLVELGIARELTGKRRNRLFVYDQYLAALNEGTEAP